MIWTNNIDAISAEYRGIAERWYADAAERRVRRHAFGGNATERH